MSVVPESLANVVGVDKENMSHVIQEVSVYPLLGV